MPESERLKDIAKCLQYHRDGLAQHRLAMSPSAIYLEEQTCNFLADLYGRILKDKVAKDE